MKNQSALQYALGLWGQFRAVPGLPDTTAGMRQVAEVLRYLDYHLEQIRGLGGSAWRAWIRENLPRCWETDYILSLVTRDYFGVRTGQSWDNPSWRELLLKAARGGDKAYGTLEKVREVAYSMGRLNFPLYERVTQVCGYFANNDAVGKLTTQELLAAYDLGIILPNGGLRCRSSSRELQERVPGEVWQAAKASPCYWAAGEAPEVKWVSHSEFYGRIVLTKERIAGRKLSFPSSTLKNGYECPLCQNWHRRGDLR